MHAEVTPMTAWASDVHQMAVEGWESGPFPDLQDNGRFCFSRSTEKRSFPKSMCDFSEDAGT
jgi:hypothetical protein